MTKRRPLPLLSLLLLCLSISSCLPIPNVKLELDVPPLIYRIPPASVRTVYVTVPGYREAHTPEAFNQTYYLRYFDPSQVTDTVLVVMPGIFGGASSIDPLARQFVAAIDGLEVWVIDRRANALEDRQVMTQALTLNQPELAYEYYVQNLNTPEGFNRIPAEEVPFMRYWGLDVHLKDLHRVIEQAHTRAPHVVLGGHSLGASIAGFYAAYNVGTADTPRYGHEYIDGLLLLDGVLGRTGGYQRDDIGLSIGPVSLIPNSQELESGQGSPYLQFGLTPGYYAREETMALLARLRPEELSPGGFVRFPATNMAVFGLSNDDQYVSATVFGVSMGDALDADFGGNLTAVLIDGWAGVYSRSVVGVAKDAEVVGWTEGNIAREVTDPFAYARSYSYVTTNRSEWYFPIRLLVDISVLDISLSDNPMFTANSNVTTPTLAFGAGRGLVQNLQGFSSYANARIGSSFTSIILPDYTHLDITSARDNPVVPVFARWKRNVIH